MGQKPLFSQSNIAALEGKSLALPSGHKAFHQFEPVPTFHPLYATLLEINHETVFIAEQLKTGRVVEARDSLAAIHDKVHSLAQNLLSLPPRPDAQ